MSAASSSSTVIFSITMSSQAYQSRDQAVIEARNFVYGNSYGTLSTVNHGAHEFSGFPAGQIEYYADVAASDASLLMIKVDMSSAFRNITLGSPASLSIRTGDAPNAMSPLHMAANHRIIIYGEFEEATPTQSEKDKFFQLHPDARDWEPGHPGFHHTEWVKFVIVGLYYIGGFGGEHYIGKLPVDKYKTVHVFDDITETYDEKSPLLGASERRPYWFVRLFRWMLS